MSDRGCYVKLLLLIIKTFKPTLMCYCKARGGNIPCSRTSWKGIREKESREGEKGREKKQKEKGGD